jgi:hypothetical protein
MALPRGAQDYPFSFEVIGNGSAEIVTLVCFGARAASCLRPNGIARAVATMLFALGGSGCAWANDDAAEPPSPNHWQFSVGQRLWQAQWDSWNVDPFATGVAVGDDRFEVVEARRAQPKAARILSLSLRYRGAFVSASTLSSTSYSLRETATPNGADVEAARDERDLSIGYVFDRGLSLSLGTKTVKQRFGPDSYSWKGPVIGLGGNAALAPGWGLYANGGFGKLQGNFPIADVSGRTSFDADYRLIEAGVVRIFQASRLVRSIVLTAGYRTQRMATTDYALAVIVSGQPRRQNTTGELVDVTQGLVLGLQFAF